MLCNMLLVPTIFREHFRHAHPGVEPTQFIVDGIEGGTLALICTRALLDTGDDLPMNTAAKLSQRTTVWADRLVDIVEGEW